MAYYTEKFPALAPLVVYRELGTPLATAAFTAHENAGFYGLETTPRRMLSDALSPRTPVPGLFLSRQDVVSPGIAGSLWGGLLSAAAIDPAAQCSGDRQSRRGLFQVRPAGAGRALTRRALG